MTRLATIGAILKKDLIVLRVMIAPVVVLILLQPWYPYLERYHIQGFVVVAAIASLFLAIAAVQANSPASQRHDWLTRPIRRLDLLAAKTLFMILVIGLPWMIGAYLDNILNQHLSAGEAMMAAGGQLIFVILVAPLIALACVTANLIEILIAGVALALVIFSIAGLASSDRFAPITYYRGSEMQWMSEPVLVFLGLAGSILVIWLQYGRRRTLGARVAIAGSILVTAAATAAAAGMTPPSVSGEGPTSAKLTDPGLCVVAHPHDGQGGGEPVANLDQWSKSERNLAGAGALPVLTTTRLTGLPAGWAVAADRLDLISAGDGPGQVAGQIWTNFGGPGAMNTNWLFSAGRAAALMRPDAKLHLDARFTAMKPVRTWTFANDDKRHHLPGLGWCAAQAARSSFVDCRFGWPHPAMIRVSFAGQPDTCTVDCAHPMRTPAFLQLPITNHKGLRADGLPGDKFVVTAYAFAGQIRRSVDIAGPAPFCPERITPPSEEELRRMAAFAPHDLDKDGKLNRDEYFKLARDLGYAGEEADLFRRRDKDKDGFVSAEEYRDPF